MDRIKKAGLYITCILSGVYTADMIYRIIRYINAFSSGDSFEKTVMLMGTIFLDSGSFMILSAVCALLIAVSAFVFKVLKKMTAVSFIINFVSAVLFIIASCVNGVEFSTVMYIFVIAVPIYLLSGLWCIYFCIKDLCKYFLNNNYEEIN